MHLATLRKIDCQLRGIVLTFRQTRQTNTNEISVKGQLQDLHS